MALAFMGDIACSTIAALPTLNVSFMKRPKAIHWKFVHKRTLKKEKKLPRGKKEAHQLASLFALLGSNHVHRIVH